jgi:hypothetical protein
VKRSSVIFGAAGDLEGMDGRRLLVFPPGLNKRAPSARQHLNEAVESDSMQSTVFKQAITYDDPS